MTRNRHDCDLMTTQHLGLTPTCCTTKDALEEKFLYLQTTYVFFDDFISPYMASEGNVHFKMALVLMVTSHGLVGHFCKIAV